MSTVDTCTPSGLKANAACGRKVKNLLPDATAPKKDDDWWRKVKVDIRDGLLATELTPPQFVQERFGLAIPDSVQGFARVAGRRVGEVPATLGTAPTERSTGQAPVQILVAEARREADGQVVRLDHRQGRHRPTSSPIASSTALGNPPLEWKLIVRSETPQPGGGLALWNLAGLPDGTYTLRVVVEDKDRGELSNFIVVTVGQGRHRRLQRPGRRRPTPTLDFGDGL